MMQLPNDYQTIAAKGDGAGRMAPGVYVLKVVAAEDGTKEARPNLKLYASAYSPDGKLVRDAAAADAADMWRFRYEVNLNSFDQPGQVDWGKLKGVMAKFEESNKGFTFDGDEQALVGKFVGVALRDESYVSKRDGQVKHVLRPSRWLSVEQAKAGDVDPSLLEPKVGKGVEQAQAQASAPAPAAGPDLADDDIPF